MLLTIAPSKILANENDFNDFEDEFIEEKVEVYDPLEGYNRTMTSFNDYVYINLLTPTSKTYADTLPEPLRISISNFFDNIMFPIRFTNNLLQLKFQNSAEEFLRFTINSTVGILGLFDPAKHSFGLQEHNEDFGQTLGFYGVGEGFHVVLPFLGPSNLRDMVGLASDSYLSALSNTGSSDIKYKIIDNTTQTIVVKAYSTINATSLRVGQYENLRKDALDLYPFLRDMYNQKRAREIQE